MIVKVYKDPVVLVHSCEGSTEPDLYVISGLNTLDVLISVLGQVI